MTSSQYSLVVSYQLMENHIPATVLDAKEGFSAFQTADGATVLLSIGNDGVFRASVEEDDTATGWTTIDLTANLSQNFPTGTTLSAKSFAASLNTGTGVLTVLLAITVASGSTSKDEVWLITGSSGIEPSKWLVNPALTEFRILGYDAQSVSPITAIQASTLQVTKLFLENGLDSSDSTLAIATVKDPAEPNELRCFLLALNAGVSPVWSYYPQEQNIGIDQLLAIVPGRAFGSSASGLYKLYSLNGIPSLTFLPSLGEFGPPNANILTVPDGATAIASLVYQPTGTTAYSDLFVAGQGTISYFPYNQPRPHQPIPLISSPLINGVTQLHAVNANDTVILWGLNGNGQVFYTKAALVNRADPTAWQRPLPLLSGVTATGPLTGAAADECALFALSSLATGAVATGINNGPIRLARNPTTGHWSTNIMPMPLTSDCITLKTYTTRVLLLNEGGVPQGGQTITAAVSSDCVLIVNGKAKSLSPQDPFPVTTDLSGYVNFIHGVSSLAAVQLTLTLPDGSQQTIDPSGHVYTTLSGISSSQQLLSATYVDANGNQQSIVAAGTSDTVVNGVASGLQSLTSKSSQLPRAAALKATNQAPSLELGDDLLTDIGDLVQYIVHVAEDVANVVIQDIGNALKFVVTIAEDVFTAVVQTVEDVFHAITALFKWIGAEFEALFRWIGFLFNWSDFLAIRDVLKALINQTLQSVESVAETWKLQGDRWFDELRSSILPNFSPEKSLPNLGNRSLQDSWSTYQPAPAPIGSGQVDLRSDPRMGWLSDRLQTPPTSSSLGAGAVTQAANLSAGADDPFQAVEQAIQTLFKDLKNVFSDLENQLSSLIDGEISAKSFLMSIITQLKELAVDVAQTLFDALMGILGTAVSLADSAANAKIDIPILSPLYKAVSGDDLTLLDLNCLVLAIPITIIYKIATDQSPVGTFTTENATEAVKKAFSKASTIETDQSPVGTLTTEKATDAVKKPFSTASVAEVSFMAVENSSDGPSSPSSKNESDSPSSPDTLTKWTGGILIFQFASLSFVGISEYFKATPETNICYGFDLSARTVRGLLEIINDGEPMEVGGSLVWTEFVVNLALWCTYVYYMVSDGVASERVEEVTLVDANVSLAWGIWQLVNIHTITTAGGDCPWGRTGEAVIELLEPFQTGACLEEAAWQVVAVLIGLRGVSAVVAGYSRL